jgi:hypothetical protein
MKAFITRARRFRRRKDEPMKSRLNVLLINGSPSCGCQYCLTNNPGTCIIGDDDMAFILQDFKWADITIWSMPLFDLSIPSLTMPTMSQILLSTARAVISVSQTIWGMTSFPWIMESSGKILNQVLKKRRSCPVRDGKQSSWCISTGRSFLRTPY